MLIRDTVRLEPDKFKLHFHDAILDTLHIKYANRVIPNEGLVICVEGLTRRGEPMIYPGDGAIHMKVEFRLLVFRPFIGEVIFGRVRAQDASGIRVSLEFFEDVIIPRPHLPKDSHFVVERQSWVWSYNAAEYDITQQDTLLFKVLGVEYGLKKARKKEEKTEDKKKDEKSAPVASVLTGGEGEQDTEEEKKIMICDRKPPLRVIGTIEFQGLGVVSWWDADKTMGVDDAQSQLTTEEGLEAANAQSGQNDSNDQVNGDHSDQKQQVKENPHNPSTAIETTQ